MLQLLYLDISKVDRMLHMECAWEVAGIQGSAGTLLGRSFVNPTR
jgi:hypothetical protein